MKTYIVVGAHAAVQCVGAMVAMLVAAKMDECHEAVNIYAADEFSRAVVENDLGRPWCEPISAWTWMRTWHDADEWVSWENDPTVQDF